MRALLIAVIGIFMAVPAVAQQSPTVPSYCKPGWASSGNLNSEKLTICEAVSLREAWTWPKERKTCDLTAPAWRRCFGPSVTVVADNGQVYRAYVAKKISGRNGSWWELLVYFEEQPNAPYSPFNLHRLIFDCRGDYMDSSIPGSNFQYAPPLSIAGRLSAIACALK